MASMKQYELLNWATDVLEAHNSETGIAEILLRHHLNVERSTYFMMMQDVIPKETVEAFKQDIHKHVETGIPVQHLTGYEHFYGRVFTVSHDTLIPRPETEELVLHVINELKTISHDNPVIVDVGTGSGVIAITLAKEIPQAKVYATDISHDALAIARKNAERLKADVTFYQGDFLHPILDQGICPHVIISNPPYIAESDRSTLSRTVKLFDPSLALFAENDGLRAYEDITALSTDLPCVPKLIAYEIGHTQGEDVSDIIKAYYPECHVQVIADINENDRIVSAKNFKHDTNNS